MDSFNALTTMLLKDNKVQVQKKTPKFEKFDESFSPSPIRDAIRDDISSISKYSRPSNLTVSQKPQSKRPSI